MSFIHPYLLWGLLAISIPVIIHLFNFRRFRKMYFTNVRYLEELKQQTQKQSRLRHLVVLILRMLAVACLVIAFAQPFLPVKNTPAEQGSGNAVSIFVDNSFSMSAEASTGRLLDVAKEKARQILTTYGTGDVFQILTHDFEGRHQRLLSKDEFEDFLDEIVLTPSVKNLSDIIRRQNDALDSYPSRNRIIFVISDFQQSISDFSNILPDTSTVLFFVPVDALHSDNLFIDSCWFESPVHQIDQPVSLMVRVKNSSETGYEKIPVKLTINGNQKALASFNLDPGKSAEIKLPFTNYESGYHFGTLEITDYPVSYDDKFFFSYEVAGTIPVLCLYDEAENTFINSLFLNDSAFSFTNVNYKSINYDDFKDQSLIILNSLKTIPTGLGDELLRYVESGGNILFIPAPGFDSAGYAQFLSGAGLGSIAQERITETTVDQLELQSPLFTDVFEKVPGSGIQLPENTDYPKVQKYFPLKFYSGSTVLPLMSMRNGDRFLVSASVGKGEIYALSVPLQPDYSNFPRHALFVPVFYRMALVSAAVSPIYYTIGRDELIAFSKDQPVGENPLRISNIETGYEFIPGILAAGRKSSVQLFNQVHDAGHYILSHESDTLECLSFNFDRRESDLKCLTSGEIAELANQTGLKNLVILKESEKPVTQEIKQVSQGVRLWKWFVALALVFLLGEVVLLRVWG